MTVNRITPLPTGPSKGRLIVSQQVSDESRAILQNSSGPDGQHEGLVYWLGRRVDADTVVLAVTAPQTDHGFGHVFVTEEEVGRMSRLARKQGLAIVAQVHSHPGFDTRHSDGDDHLILMPFEGMFSLVVADFGQGQMHHTKGTGLHQFQNGRWIKIEATYEDAFLIIPSRL